jgi:hypothetical protein
LLWWVKTASGKRGDDAVLIYFADDVIIAVGDIHVAVSIKGQTARVVEGRGRRWTAADFFAGRDPVLEAALAAEIP